MQFFVLLLCSVLIPLATAEVKEPEAPETVELNPPVGPVRGSVMTSRLGKKIYSFRGLRYAEAPVGERRFKPPVPALPWRDVFDATEEGSACPQPREKNQSEDCLLLNVYTTKLPSATNSSKSENPKRPVIVYFHNGAFFYFSGQSYMVGPQYIMNQEIVFVTVNYRLGTLGLISTGDAHAPGNLALKDQVVALRWVQKNIATFGGDPNCVTIAGYSSGAWSVVLHLLSPMTKGLFHRAIAMSGSPIYHDSLPYHQNHIVRKQAEIFGCPTNTTESMIDCLKTKDALEFGNSVPKFFEWNGSPSMIWSPVVEPEIPGVERFLTAQPADLIRQGKIHSVPFITGTTKDGMASRLIFPILDARRGDTFYFKEFNNDWEEYAPIVFEYERDTPRSREISRTLRQMYFGKQPVSLETVDKLADIYRDNLAFSVYRTVNLISQHSKKPAYFYEFGYQGHFSFATWPLTTKAYGVTHHDDLLYLFHYINSPFYTEKDPDSPMVERMTSIWGNFAKTGEPIPSDNPLFANVTWTPFTAENKKYLEIRNELVLKTNFREARMNEWDRLFSLDTADMKGGSSSCYRCASCVTVFFSLSFFFLLSPVCVTIVCN